jgi:hypothetical protein
VHEFFLTDHRADASSSRARADSRHRAAAVPVCSRRTNRADLKALRAFVVSGLMPGARKKFPQLMHGTDATANVDFTFSGTRRRPFRSVPGERIEPVRESCARSLSAG